MPDVDLTEVYCEFAFVTNDHDCDLVTQKLGIEPSRCFNKGDKAPTKDANRESFRPWGLWALRSEPVIEEDYSLDSHVKFLRKKLEDKVDEINGLRTEYNFKGEFLVSLDTEDITAGFDVARDNLLFICSIAETFRCSLMTKAKFK